MRTSPGRQRGDSVFPLRGGALVLCGIFLGLWLVLPGCRGCRSGEADAEKQKKEEAEKKKKEKEKAPFDAGRDFTQPNPRDTTSMACKPGHWTAYRWEKVKANRADFIGEMELSLENSQSRQPIPLRATPFELTIERQVILPKGQEKNFSSVFYLPADVRRAALLRRISGAPDLETGSPLTSSRMPSHQYHFLVLARFYDKYKDLDKLPAVRPRFSQLKKSEEGIFPEIEKPVEPFFRISPAAGEKPPPLPDHAAEWTGIACILWDDVQPAALSADQRTALLDWLHWGGVLIVSGPGSLGGLRGSFLEPYLPAASPGTRDLDAEDLAPLNEFSSEGAKPLEPAKPWSGVSLQLNPQATWTPRCGHLAAERRVGRGRVVLSAFRLTEREFRNWPGLDQFYNACLLRRPARRFEKNSEETITAQWADSAELLDAARVTAVRYFARDEGLEWKDYAPDAAARRPVDLEATESATFSPTEEPSPSGPGLAAWNDFSPVASAARESLKRAARVEVPGRSFIIWVLTMYLMALVPLNWSVFKTLGRVEWAWFAAPVIALACTGLVIKLAQLDIGFVRSRTEIAVLEIQGDYSRAHLTRYDALYTSLTTSYDFCFDDGAAAALPLPAVAKPEEYRPAAGQTMQQLRYRPGDQALLSGLPVSSNATGLVHSEEMFDLGGKLTVLTASNGTMQIVNKTKLTLRGVGVIQKTESENLRIAWVGTLKPGGSRFLNWVRESSTVSGGRLWSDERNEDRLSAAGDAKDLQGELNIRPLLDLAQRTKNLRPGDLRLVAWTDEELPGLKITPQAPQGRHAALVIAHLAYGDPPPPQRDVNTPSTATFIPDNP